MDRIITSTIRNVTNPDEPDGAGAAITSKLSNNQLSYFDFNMPRGTWRLRTRVKVRSIRSQNFRRVAFSLRRGRQSNHINTALRDGRFSTGQARDRRLWARGRCARGIEQRGRVGRERRAAQTGTGCHSQAGSRRDCGRPFHGTST
jgi:hypothetical protein